MIEPVNDVSVADLEIIQERVIKIHPILYVFVFDRVVHYCLYEYIAQSGGGIFSLFPLLDRPLRRTDTGIAWALFKTMTRRAGVACVIIHNTSANVSVRAS